MGLPPVHWPHLNDVTVIRNLDMLGHPNAIWAIRRATPSLRDPMTPMTPAVGTNSSALVVDFLDFGINSLRWPAFNIADSCICAGAFLIIIDLAAPFFKKKKV